MGAHSTVRNSSGTSTVTAAKGGKEHYDDGRALAAATECFELMDKRRIPCPQPLVTGEIDNDKENTPLSSISSTESISSMSSTSSCCGSWRILSTTDDDEDRHNRMLPELTSSLRRNLMNAVTGSKKRAKSVRFNLDATQVLEAAAPPRRRLGRSDRKQSCLLSYCAPPQPATSTRAATTAASLRRRPQRTNSTNALVWETPEPERQGDKYLQHHNDADDEDADNHHLIWYSSQELAELHEQLVPDTCAFMVRNKPYSGRCLQALRRLYDECNDKNNTNDMEEEAEVENEQSCIYGFEREGGNTPRSEAVDMTGTTTMVAPPYFFHDPTTVLGLERMIMGLSHFHTAARKYRYALLRQLRCNNQETLQEPVPAAAYFNSNNNNNKYYNGLEASKQNDLTCVVSGRFAHKLALALADSLYNHPSTTHS